MRDPASYRWRRLTPIEKRRIARRDRRDRPIIQAAFAAAIEREIGNVMSGIFMRGWATIGAGLEEAAQAASEHLLAEKARLEALLAETREMVEESGD